MADGAGKHHHNADLLLDFRRHRLPPPLMMLALRGQFRVSAGMESPLGDGEAQSSSQEQVGVTVNAATSLSTRAHVFGYSSATTEAMAQVNMAWPPGNDVFKA